MIQTRMSAVSQWFLSRSRNIKRIITLIVDVIAIVLALWLAFSLRYSVVYIPSEQQLWLFVLAPALAIPIFIKFGLYRAIVRYLGMRALWTVVKATFLYALILAVVTLMAGAEHTGVVPRTVYGINALIVLLFVGGSRLIARWWFAQYAERQQTIQAHFRKSAVIIYGAGAAGAQLAVTLKMSNAMEPVAFIDDDKHIIKQQVAGITVYSFDKLASLIDRFKVTDILLAMPSASRRRRNEIIQKLEPYPVHVRTLPSLSDIADGKVKVSDLQEVDIADLLGRDQVKPIPNLLVANIQDKVVMVTGAGGSIGAELCRQISRIKPKILILYELNEYALYAIERELRPFVTTDMQLYPFLGSVQNQQRIESICRQFAVETIYHAAAYKHVPLVEHNVTQGVENNILGTLHCAQAAIATHVDTFVLISTDKAVRPTNTMGATKRFAELILQALAETPNMTTRFTMVRFGNVLGSSGSVVPLFRQQIAAGGPVTVTDPEIIRYFMTIPEAAELVIQAGAMGKGGDVFVLDMGEPVKIVDMAKRMIHLSGYTERTEDNPHGDIDIVYTGLRPGEKLYEELLIGDNVSETDHKKIMRAQEKVVPWQQLSSTLASLTAASDANDNEQLRAILLDIVDGYQPQCEIQDWLKQ